MHTLHVIANPVVPTHKSHEFDAHTVFIIKLCDLLVSKGHTVHFYGVKSSIDQVSHTHHHTVIDDHDYPSLKIFGDPDFLLARQTERLLNIRRELANKFRENLEENLKRFYKSGDIVFHGFDINAYHGMIHLQYCMGGYTGGNWNIIYCSKFLLDEREKQRRSDNFVGKVAHIYPYFNASDFEYSDNKDGSILYLARCHYHKGIHIFLDLAKKLPMTKFIVAGSCTEYNPVSKILQSGSEIYTLPDNVTYCGLVSGDVKKRLLSQCSLLIQPTTYIEPLGFNVIEANLSGTPVLAPNNGGFQETVVHGLNGFLYNSIDELEGYVTKSAELSPKNCYSHANEKFCKEKFYSHFKTFLDELSLSEVKGKISASATSKEKRQKQKLKQKQKLNPRVQSHQEKNQLYPRGKRSQR